MRLTDKLLDTDFFPGLWKIGLIMPIWSTVYSAHQKDLWQWWLLFFLWRRLTEDYLWAGVVVTWNEGLKTIYNFLSVAPSHGRSAGIFLQWIVLEAVAFLCLNCIRVQACFFWREYTGESDFKMAARTLTKRAFLTLCRLIACCLIWIHFLQDQVMS